MSDFLQRVSVIAELERIGWAYLPASENELKVLCPAHKETTPSCAINTEKRLFKCQAASCGTAGDIFTFVSLALSSSGKLVTRASVMTEMEARYGVEDEKTTDSAAVERWHDKIWEAGPLLEELRKRAISDRVIRERRLGFGEGRIMIPIPNAIGAYVNVRKYLPGAPGAQKMRNLKGRSKPRPYPIDQLHFSTIIVCGGEMKALATADRMNAFGIGAICLTAGEGEGWGANKHLLRGKRVFVCMDIDEGGRVASGKLCAMFKGDATWVGDLDLSDVLDKALYPKGDLNDYWMLPTASTEQFLAKMGTVQEWTSAGAVPDAPDVPEPEAKVIELQDVGRADCVGRIVHLKTTVSAMDTVPYLVPKSVTVMCDRDQSFCTSCAALGATRDETGRATLTLRPDSPAIVAMVGAPAKGQRTELLKGLRMPPCKTAVLKAIDHYAVEDVRLAPQLDFSSRGSDAVVQPCLYVGKGLEVNASYKLTGRVYPRPDNQQAVLLACEASPAEDALSDLQLTDEQLAELVLFKPTEWTQEAVEAKLETLYADLAANVTKIYMRRDMHLAADMAWHSPLLMTMDGRTCKAWTEVLILGDSSQGKSDMAKYMLQHYGLGHKVDCKSATVAGLLGGLTPMGNRWMISWGHVPRQDKRLVILEELKGAHPDVIGKLTEMRSSGVAEVNKIEKWKTHARTRLLAMSNPRGDRPISRYNFGVEAVVELVGTLEDLRRFDLTMVAASGQVLAEDIAKMQEEPPIVPHTHLSTLCRRLILWGWTRTEKQVIHLQEAMDEISIQSRLLTTEFTEAVPLVDKGGIRYKLARLAAALAVRTFSSGDDLRSVMVRKCHVQVVADFMRRCYRDRFFGYADYSEAVRASESIASPDEVRARVMATPFPKDFAEQVLHTVEIECRDLSDWCGWERQDSIDLLSFFVRRRCLIRDGRSYRKTSAFIDLLKELLRSPRIKTAGRPEHIKERARAKTGNTTGVQPGSHNEY